MRLIMTLLLAGALSATAGAASECRLVPLDKMPITILASGAMSVPLKVNGTMIPVLVDTVSPQSMIRPETAARLKLEPQAAGGFKTPVVEIGATAIHDVTFAPMPPIPFAAGAEGNAATDLFNAFDLEFDFAGGHLLLFSQAHCPAKAAYWTSGPHTEVPLAWVTDGPMRAPVIPVKLDGVDAYAFISTMLPHSQMPEPVGKVFGVSGPTMQGPFKQLVIGDVTLADPGIAVFPGGNCTQNGKPCFTLSINTLRRLHFLIAKEENKVYLTTAEAR